MSNRIKFKALNSVLKWVFNYCGLVNTPLCSLRFPSKSRRKDVCTTNTRKLQVLHRTYYCTSPTRVPQCAILEFYAAYTGSYRRFGTTYRSHLQGSWIASWLKMEQVSCPETPVTTSLCYVTYQKNEYIIYTAAEASNRAVFKAQWRRKVIEWSCVHS
jgi:hypothetical protein